MPDGTNTGQVPGTSPSGGIRINPNVQPQEGQNHVPLKDRFVTAVAESKEGQGLLADIRNFISSVICRAQGSCSGRIQEAVRKAGVAGYRRHLASDPRKWEAFLSNGQHLRWDASSMDSQKYWYGSSGYWAKLRDTGLDRCCLKSASNYPPSEAFPVAADGLPFNGVVRIDADGYFADFDRIGFGEGTLKPFAQARVVQVLKAEEGFPPFGVSATGVFTQTEGIVSMAGFNPFTLVAGYFIGKKAGWF